MSTVAERSVRRWGRKRYARNVARLVLPDVLTNMFVGMGLDVPPDLDDRVDLIMKGATL